MTAQIDTLTWITLTTSRGTDAICAEASSARTIEAMHRRAEASGGIVSHYTRPFGIHWDGCQLRPIEMRRLRAGLRRNAA